MKKSCSLLILGVLVSASVIGIMTAISPMLELQKTSTNITAFSPHSPILIMTDASFVSQGWPGNGTQLSPYVIESLEISTEDTGIEILNTNAHFVIRNCTLSSPIFGEGTGIHIENAHNGRIVNCTISSLDTGIYVRASDYCSITNNTVSECSSNGVELISSDYSTVVDNRVMNQDGYGFYFAILSNCLMMNNSISNCKEMGFALASTVDSNIMGNVIEDSGRFGLYFAGCLNCTFINNTLEEGGFGVSSVYDYNWIQNFSGNVVNGKALGYFIGKNHTTLDGTQYGQVFLVYCFNVSISSGVFLNSSVGVSLFSCANCSVENTEIGGNLYGIDLLDSENTTLTNNALINCGVRFQGDEDKHWRIAATGNSVNGKLFGYFLDKDNLVIDGTDYGQFILVSSSNLSITNGTFDSVTVGFTAYSSFNCSISDASFTDNYRDGMVFLGSNNCTMTNVTSTGSRGKGISLEASNYTSVVDCEIHGNRDTGIWVYISERFLFDSNQIYDNGAPFYLYGTNYGRISNNSIHDNPGRFRLYVVNWLEIVNNTISGCLVDGIYMDYTSGVVIVGNKIYGNTVYGLNVRSNALFSKIYNNMIGFNGGGNAIDAGMFNDWDDGISTGNIWSDYSGTGVYSVGGMGVDNYPLGFLTWQDDVEYIVGSVVPPVTWDVRLPNPESYTLFWDGAPIAHGSLNSSLEHISKSIEGLTIGSYNLTIVVTDESGYSLVDEVRITVIHEPVTTTTTVTTTPTTTTESPTTTDTSTSTTPATTDTETGTQPPPAIPMVIIITTVGVLGVIVIILVVIIKKK